MAESQDQGSDKSWYPGTQGKTEGKTGREKGPFRWCGKALTFSLYQVVKGFFCFVGVAGSVGDLCSATDLLGPPLGDEGRGGCKLVVLEPQENITTLLSRMREGDRAALDELIPLVYDQLHAMAQNCFRGEAEGHTLRATALVHEAYLRLAGAKVEWQDRVHFFAVAARAMRRILVDHARTRQRLKRGGEFSKVNLEEAAMVGEASSGTVVALDEALVRLTELDARKGQAIELIYFGGLSYRETAAALQISEATLDRDLRMAKAWVYRELGGVAS